MMGATGHPNFHRGCLEERLHQGRKKAVIEKYLQTILEPYRKWHRKGAQET